ncbi:MAG TPA: hypothetical protein VMW41_04385 [Candidatus Bathyarchaeia archaeon]|nr:hypothetical protein [Candidatus Bathyarchaeia archaeon]
MFSVIALWQLLKRKLIPNKGISGNKEKVKQKYALARKLIKNPNKITLELFKEVCEALQGIDPKIDRVLKKADRISRTLDFLSGGDPIGFIVCNIQVKTKRDKEKKEKLLFFIDLVNDIRDEVNAALVRIKVAKVENNIGSQNTAANFVTAASGPTSIATVSMAIVVASTVGIAQTSGIIPTTSFLSKNEPQIQETINPQTTITETATPVPSPVLTSAPTATPTLTFSTVETTIFVSAQEEGTTYNAPSSGTYRFTITGGAYLADPAKGWEAKVMIYKNRPIDWSGPNNTHTNWDYLVGYPDSKPAREEVEQLGKGQRIDIFLNKDEHLIFMVFDSKGDFGDNQGGMYVDVQRGTLTTPASVEGLEFISYAECNQTPINTNTLNAFYGTSQKNSTVEVEAGKSYWIGMSDGLNNGQFKDESDKGKAEADAFVNEENITFSVTLNDSELKLSGATKMEYTNAGFWEVNGYYCTGILEIGSYKIVGTTYHKGNYVDSASFTLIAK